ncbi:MAG: hypothetical protein JNM76_15030 [Betaproteobacteria bacterium]|nr:hypothetical protein [Betaproteobacteria bacterium]
MNTRAKLLTTALIATLPALAPAAHARAIPMIEQDIQIIESSGNVTVEVNGQIVQGEEAKKYVEDARRSVEEARRSASEAQKHARHTRERALAHTDSLREEIRLRMPDMAGLGDALSNSVAYSFTTGNVKSIKNAPYSGEVINERVQTLADGNQLVKRTTNRVYRDSQGATRQEVLDANGQLKVVHIRDAEGARFVVTPASKSAIKIMSPRGLVDGKTAEWTGKGDGGKRIVIQSGGAEKGEKSEKGDIVIRTGENIVVKRVNVDGKEKSEEIRVQMGPGEFSFSSGGLVDLAKLGKLSELSQLSELSVLGDAFHAAGDAFAMAWRHGEPTFVRGDKSYERTTTKLGVKNFDGVTAEGKMVSYTIPAGKIGNVKPITVSSETWYSPDLQITVYSKHSDPRSGDVIYRVANLKRTEQNAELFRVPADYEVKDPLSKLAGSVRIERTEKK